MLTQRALERAQRAHANRRFFEDILNNDCYFNDFEALASVATKSIFVDYIIC